MFEDLTVLPRIYERCTGHKTAATRSTDIAMVKHWNVSSRKKVVKQLYEKFIELLQTTVGNRIKGNN